MFLREQSWRNSFALKRWGKSAYFLSQSSQRIGEMIVFLRARRNIRDVLGSALFFYLFLWILIIFIRKDFFIFFMFSREQSWRNSFAMKRCGNWCGMRYEMRVFLSQSSRRWCEMMAFLRTLRNIGDVLGSALFFFIIVNSDYFYTQRFFYLLYVFKGAKLAKFIRYEAMWKLMWDEIRDASISITKFTKMVWNDGVFEDSKKHRRCSRKCTVFFIIVNSDFF